LKKIQWYPMASHRCHVSEGSEMPKRTDICVVILVYIGGPCIFQSLSIFLCIPQGSYFLVDNGKSQLGPRGKLWCPLPSSPSSSPATEYLLSQNLYFLTRYVPFSPDLN
jgi:hypothetical protein